MRSTADDFIESLLSAKHKVYGFRLKPLSLFSLTLLERYCPNAIGGNVGPDELALAAAICSGLTTVPPWKAYLVPLHRYEKQLRAWQNYLADYMTLPEMIGHDGEQRNNPFPFALVYAAKLIKETGYSFDHVFYKMSISEVFWLVSAMGYIETGETSIMSDKEKLASELINGMTKND